MAYTNHVLYTFAEFKALMRGEAVQGTPLEPEHVFKISKRQLMYEAIWSSDEPVPVLMERYKLSDTSVRSIRNLRPIWW